MKICVLNGSPKGAYSITLHTVLYLEQQFPDCELQVLHVGQRIRAYERDMTEALAAMEAADLMIFAYPVYTFIAPSQLHRFIELIKDSGIDLSGKYATQITTSKHFYDVTAHAYIRDNCFDMGMKYIDGLSADMEDLLSEQGRAEAVSHFGYVCHCVEHDLYAPIPDAPEHSRAGYTPALDEVPKTADYPTVIVTNCAEGDTDLLGMIEDFRRCYPYETRVVNIAEYPFSGGCLGCFNCASDGKCIYKDGFDSFLRTEIQTASAIVYAFSVRDHSMGADFKRYDDRQFCNGHRTVTMGTPMGYIVSGDMTAEDNLRTVMQARCDVGHNFLAGIATDSRGIADMSDRLSYALQNKLTLPQTFYGVGGLKIFRDLIYVMRGLMRADHRFYRDHGFYDFPQKKRGTIFKMKLVGSLMANPKIRSKMGNKMNEGMVAPYRKVLGIKKDK